MANAYENLSLEELDQEIAKLQKQTDEILAKGLKLDMARGKPSAEQTALSRPMLDVITSATELKDGNGIVDNYGTPDGLPSTRALAADILGVDPQNVLVNGSSSLSLMYTLVSHGFTNGVAGNKPWYQQGKVKWLCPAPGYDRHFGITAHLGIENVPIALGSDGPDMDAVARLVESDPSVKGIWCVPKYSNPTGITYSDEVVRRFAALKPAAPDFRIYWDNAYIVHTFGDEDTELLNIFDAMKEVSARDLVYEFGSTAKVSFPGSGIAFVTASAQDMQDIRKAFQVSRVSPEKFSQLAHALYFHDKAGILEHMKKHAAVLRPRFDLVERKLTEGLGDLGIASWTHPTGGYFVSFDGLEGSARRVVKLMADLGVTLTPAGATWPYGKDPHDTNIRIAPTYPSLEDLSQALDVFVVAVKLVSAQLVRQARSEG